jgi:hypothetical protein
MEYYKDLTKFIKENDQSGAHGVIMRELAMLLAKDKKDFIEVLRNANVSMPDNADDVQVVNAFVDNAPSNRKLLLGAAYLINHKNRTVGFDGKEKVSDAGVKATYKVMYNFFGAANFEDTSDNQNDDYFNATGDDYSNAGAVAAIANLGSAITAKIGAKKNAASDALKAQQESRRAMFDTLLKQRGEQAAAKSAEVQHKEKSKRTMLVVGGVVLGAIVLGAVGYMIYKKKKG